MSPTTRATWLRSDRFLARSVARPVNRFLHIEASSGILLVAAAVAALVWANSPWAASYRDLWTTQVTIDVGGHVISEDLRHWINDGLMAIFFFVLGLEIKQELTNGQLASVRNAAVPAAGAVGGMLLPAVLYLAFNLGGAGADGWGIPMATDVAFALGVLALLGSRVPAELKVLLLALAIVDDVGAIVVIAAFYSEGLEWRWFALATAGLLLVALFKRARVRYLPVYVVLGAAVWLAMLESGVHATIAGVALGLLTPARPRQTVLEAEEVVDVLENRADVGVDDVRATAAAIRGSVSACDRMIAALHPWTSFVIVPVFALANAGIPLTSGALTSPSAVLVGVTAGLVVGKLVGVTAFSWLAVRLGLGRLPAGAGWSHVVGVGAVAGIGFTVSLFITGLAFEDDAALRSDAKIGVLVASILAAAAGAVLLARAARGLERTAPG
jgi:NhaA family Na+:H+ antiporter